MKENRKLRFTKMHGLGNDFIIFDKLSQHVPEFSQTQYQWLADRRHGIGCDQILLVEPSERDDVDFKYRILNQDGSEVAQCGNGARCFARFVYDKGLTTKKDLMVETASGNLRLKLEGDQQITVDMGAPIFNPRDIPLITSQVQIDHQFRIKISDKESIELSALSMGNPHAVIDVEAIETAAVERLGPLIETHVCFPEKVNVGFMEIVDRQHIRLRVYERGVGETQACGSGACAAVVSGIQRGLLDSRVTVILPSGTLNIRWRNDQNSDEGVLMSGPATHVYDGELPWPMS